MQSLERVVQADEGLQPSGPATPQEGDEPPLQIILHNVYRYLTAVAANLDRLHEAVADARQQFLDKRKEVWPIGLAAFVGSLCWLECCCCNRKQSAIWYLRHCFEPGHRHGTCSCQASKLQSTDSRCRHACMIDNVPLLSLNSCTIDLSQLQITCRKVTHQTPLQKQTGKRGNSAKQKRLAHM